MLKDTTDVTWDEKFKLIEKAMGFELYQHSKDIISNKCEFTDVENKIRQNGSTTAFIIRALLNQNIQFFLKTNNIEESKKISFPVDEEFRNDEYVLNLYPRMVVKIYYKLKSVGFKTSLDDYFNSHKILNDNYVKGYLDCNDRWFDSVVLFMSKNETLEMHISEIRKIYNAIKEQLKSNKLLLP